MSFTPTPLPTSKQTPKKLTQSRVKAKDFEIVAAPLCLGNISKDFSVDNMKNTGFCRYVYDFSVDYDAITADNIINICKYVMKKHGIK